MNALYVAAKEVCDFMKARKWKFCIIGGLAVIRWGEQRSTQDVDLTLLTGFGEEERFAGLLLAGFKPRRPEVMEFALQNRILLIRAANDVPVDISFAAFPYEERLLARATLFEFAPGYSFPTCSAEDLIVVKAFAGRPHDWENIQMIRARQKNGLNWRLIFEELRPLAKLKEMPEIVERLHKLARK